MQLVDFCMLDIQTLAYKNRTLAASFLYIVLLIKLQIYSVEQLLPLFRSSSTLIRLDSNQLNPYFNSFMQSTFGIELEELYPTIQYVVSFAMLPLKF